MRTRTRNIVNKSLSYPSETMSQTSFFCNNTSSTSSPTYGGSTFVTSYDEERISDSLGKGKVNKVVHRKKSFRASEQGYVPDIAITTAPYGHTIITGSTAAYRGIETNVGILGNVAGWNTSSDTGAPSGWSIDMSGINEAAMRNDCFDKAKALKADHLLNIAEANQIWPSLRSILFDAKKFDNLERFWRDIRVNLRVASNMWLAWKFGISPLLSDIQSTINALGTMRRDIDRFARQQRMTYSRKAMCPMLFAIPNIESSSNGVKTNIQSFQGRLEGPCEVRYVLVVEPNVRYFGRFFDEAQVVIDRFTSTPASFAWEKVPFSFVLDWFVDLRGLCRTIDTMIGFEPYRVVGFSRSFKYNVASDAFFERRSSCISNDVLHNATCGSVSFKHYERSLVSDSTSLSWKPRFGKSQAVITAALISQRLFNRVR